MRYETVWQKNQAKIEANFKKKIVELTKRVHDQVLEVGLYQNLCFNQRVLLREIVAICRQEQFQYLEPKDKLERIERYARRALETK